jgi:hypothetical protein
MIDPRASSTGQSPAASGARDRNAAAFTWLLGLAAFSQLTLQASRSGVLPISRGWQSLLVLWLAVLLTSGMLLVFAGRPRVRRLVSVGRSAIDAVVRIKSVSLIVGGMASLAFPVAVFGFAGRHLGGIFPRLLIFWLVILALAALLRAWFPMSPWERRVLGSAIGYGLLVRALTFVPDITAYPFSLGWSEGSRYYYASLFMSGALYHLPLHPSELHPTRYLLQSFPFLLPTLPLWFHRLWQVALWWLLPIGTAALLVNRHRLAGKWLRALVAGWIVLYLFQGPVYYHLLVMVVLILIGVDVHRPWRSTLFVVGASAWAGISRVNWFPVPALLAGCLYLLELSPRERSWKGALTWPLIWAALGTLVALASQAAYMQLTGIGLDRLASSFSSDLLAYRLLPNPTYPVGVLPAILLASAPLLLTLWSSRSAWLGRVDWPRRVFVAAALLLLGAGGLVVSLKIGGGSNLHNLDAYLVLLLLVGFSLVLRSPQREAVPRVYEALPAFRHTAFLVAVPVIFAVGAGLPWTSRDFGAAAESLRLIRETSQEHSQRGERVLFISQRHVLTFDRIPDVALEPEYETVFLMEMAMSGNRPYLDRFHELLREQAFGLIVVDRLATTYQGRSHSFGEENDAWVREVSLPILCWYEPTLSLEVPPVELFVPRASASNCDEGQN